MITATGATIVGRARVTGVRNADCALATRLAVAGMLANADLRPPGLPPAAVLIVNRLVLPASYHLAARPGGRLSPDWEREARSAMADLYRRAVRPLDTLPPPDCPAVLFSDEAELLACLARDISTGRAAERWWWRTVAKRWGSLAPRILPQLLAESPRSTPATLRLLTERAAVTGVLQHLSSGEARALLDLVCDAFDAPRPALPAPQVTHRENLPAGEDVAGRAAVPARVEPPWLAYVPPGVRLTGLSPEKVALLGVALTLAHSPPVAQSARFARAVERWWQAAAHAHRASGGVEQPRAMQPARAAAIDRSGPSSVDAPAPAAAVAPVTAAPRPRQAHSELNISGEPPISDEPPASDAVQPFEEMRTLGAPSGPSEVGKADLRAGDRALPVTPLLVEGDRPAAGVVEPVEWLDGAVTELGGALFLINLMQRLDLPGCFESDWRLASQVGPWGVLELVARGLLAEELPTFPKVGNSGPLAADPLWPALAALDGRAPGILPAGAVTVPERLRVPAGWVRWLETVGDGADQGEIASPSLARTVKGLALTATTPAPLEGPLLTGISRDLRAWLAAVTPLLRKMLARALGDEFDVVSGLLLRRGQLYVTPTHVDLVMPLAGVSIPVRVAGLDFDPGWLPAFGRVVQFHYE